MGLPPRDFIQTLCDSSNPASALTLIVTSFWKGADRVIATGSYQAIDAEKAEVAFAVDDAFHGKGLGTLLLERLAVLASRQGFVRFWAVTHADNRPMIEVFENSGFEIKEQQKGGTVEVELSVIPGEAFSQHHDPVHSPLPFSCENGPWSDCDRQQAHLNGSLASALRGMRTVEQALAFSIELPEPIGLQPVGQHAEKEMARELSVRPLFEYCLPTSFKVVEVEIARLRDLNLKRHLIRYCWINVCARHDS